MPKFIFNDEAVAEVNTDGDLFYDLTSGGYINPFEVLQDERLAEEVSNAASLVSEFLEALGRRAEKIADEKEES